MGKNRNARYLKVSVLLAWIAMTTITSTAQQLNSTQKLNSTEKLNSTQKLNSTSTTTKETVKAEKLPIGNWLNSSQKIKLTDRNPTGNCSLKVAKGDLVEWTSYGYLLNGKTFDIGEYEMLIGNNEGPKGVDEGLQGLCVGDERSIMIHPDWAYGEKGMSKPKVPPNVSVIYDIKIWNIERKRQRQVRKGMVINKMLEIEDTKVVENCLMKVQGGDRIKWDYVGKFTYGRQFDAGEFEARIDRNAVIKGVNEGMKGLCVGSKRTMRMHNSLAYGSAGTEKIPAYTNIVFDVHLRSIDRIGVGWEDMDTKQRISQTYVTKESPLKIQDQGVNGKCDTKVSEGDVVVWMNYGYLLDGTMFEDKKIETTIGDGKVLPGLEKGIVGMCVGDNRTLILHSDIAYGAKGEYKKVPSNATVIFDITILDITDIVRHGEEIESEGEDGVQVKELKPNQKLRIDILKKGHNCSMKSEEGDTITWMTSGSLLNGTLLYEGVSSGRLGEEIRSLKLITGIDKGMRGMCVGEIRRLTIHHDWAYGIKGWDGVVPPSTTLVFESELKKIKRPERYDDEL